MPIFLIKFKYMSFQKVIIVFIGVLFMSYAASAQLKVGSNPTTIGANTNLEVEATNGNKVSVSKDIGKLTIKDGTEGAGKVLISDANGVSTWTTLTIPPAQVGSTSVILNGNSYERAALSGDVNSSQNSNTVTVTRIQGQTISSAAPTAGQVLKWNGTAWAPAADVDTDTNTTYTAGSGLTLTGTVFSANDATGTTNGIIRLAGDLSGTAASPTVTRIQGQSISSTAPTSGQVLKWNGTAWAPAADTDTNTTYTAGTGLLLTGTVFSANSATTTSQGIIQLAGDLSGTAATPTVIRIQGSPVASTAPTSGQVLKWNGTAWTPAADTDTNYSAGSGLTLTGTVFSANDATTTTNGIIRLAGDLSGTAASPTVTRIQGQSISSTAPTSGQVLKWNGTAWAPAADTDTNTTYTAGTGLTLTGTVFSANNATSTATGMVQLAGDLGGTAVTPTVSRIQGQAVSSTAPASGQVLKWNGTAWTPSADNNTTYDGSETVVTAGNEITVTGSGTTAAPYVISSNSGITTITSSFTATSANSTILCNVPADGMTLTLPSASANSGKKMVIRKIDNDNDVLTFSPAINYSTTQTISTLNFVKTITIQSNGTGWWVISE